MVAAAGAPPRCSSPGGRPACSLFVPPTPYPVSTASLGLRVVGFSIALTAVTAIVSGLLPALRGSQSDVAVALKEAAPASVGGGRGRLRQGLVVAQVALSLLLLVGAALFLRSLARAQSMDVGYSARQGFMASMDLLAGGYDQERGLAFYQQALARISTLPGVTDASVATAPLGISSGSDTCVDVGYVRAGRADARTGRVGPDYETLGVDLAKAAASPRDIADQPEVVVINGTMATVLRDGRCRREAAFGSGPATVVGVARRSASSRKRREATYMAILQSYRQAFCSCGQPVNRPGRSRRCSASCGRSTRAFRCSTSGRWPNTGRSASSSRRWRPRCWDSSACSR
jgi:hypothetical protein